MKTPVWAGMAILALGLGSLFLPIPRGARVVVMAGDTPTGVEIRREEKVAPVPLSVALMLAGSGVIVVGRIATRDRRSRSPAG
jgi:hypothetical protein